MAVSLHLEFLVGETNKSLRALAVDSFLSLFFLMLLSFLFLVPGIAVRDIGVFLVILGLLRFFRAIPHLPLLRRLKDVPFRRRFVLNVALALAASGLLLWAGIEFLSAQEGSAFGNLVTAAFFLLVGATATAWDLLLRVGELRHEIHAQEGEHQPPSTTP